MTPPRSLAFAVNGGLGAASAARRAVLAGDGAVPTSAREDILLLVSELVTNAVRHAGVGPDRSLRVELSRRPRRVRVEVAHPGNGFQHDPGRPSLDADGGWGWSSSIESRTLGIASRADGVCVWFELRSKA
jgi:anti-sigma regulatory factor (Ser/Thr protein kinase)